MKRSPIIPAFVAASTLALAGCAGASSATPSSTSADDRPVVVASTSVYGQIAEEIGGDAVQVVSIVSSTSQDPHEFEPSAQDQLTVADADLIIENGGGYDAFVDALIESTGSSAHVLTAAEFSDAWPGEDGEEHEHADEDADEDHAGHDHIEGFNEHVWYDPDTIEHVAEGIAEELGELVPADAATFTANAEAFVAQIETLETALGAIEADHKGAKVFVTEPVPVYLIEAAGLENVTPAEFSEAVEEGQDVPPATLLEATELIKSGGVDVVIQNTQTGGAETTQVVDEAEGLGIPVIAFSETLPEGQTYISWMQDNIDALAEALAP
ncbi:MAG: zinc ABC transporter substrate-binding protein [Microbacterium sp.]|uniref:metal ABC transporter substrate-binding protein n=1 Tax=Microbacterium sp. TaxID=51671 RepID=UPI0039E5298A